MRQLLLLFSFLTLFNTLYSQDSVSCYYNYNWEVCKKTDAFFFRVIHRQKKEEWMVKDYYISGELQMIGFYKDKKCKFKQGDFYYYFKNGQLEQKVSYNNNLLEGPIYGYFEDGSVSQEGEYKNGKKNGMFKYFYTTGTVSWYEQFKLDSLILRECWNEKGQDMDPEFPPHVEAFIAGGTRSLYFLVEENFSYPNEEITKDLTIEVEVTFIVSKEGKISNIKVTGTNKPWVEKEIIRVFNLMPKWYPSLDHMRAVESVVTIPLLFKHIGKK
ncbi:MAG: energy transducer TonB [Flavobacteriia bacterium]|nr:energy transducer TonB [Flavobacteriia bacterium]